MDLLSITFNFFLAIFAGGLIGLERSYNGHAAGFRTYSLVALASSMLMQVATISPSWHAVTASGTALSDPTRVVQGLCAGIGFLGAGVIVKDGYTVRGLTTAASIWVTAALGILIGSGFYRPAFVGLVMTMSALTFFRYIENKLPHRNYVHFYLKFPREHTMPESEVRKYVYQHNYKVAEISYELNGGGKTFEYHLNMWSMNPHAHSELVHALEHLPNLLELRILPSRD